MPAISVFSDVALNDQDKTITYIANTWANLHSLRVEYTASADAGSRLLEVRFLDKSGDVVYALDHATAFIASDVMIVNFSPGATTVAPVDNTSEGSQHIAAGLPTSGSIRVLATAGSNAADDMIVHAVVEHG